MRKNYNLDVNKVFDYYLTHTKKETSEYFKVSTSTVDRLMRKHNMYKHKKIFFDKDLVLKMLSEGKKHSEIAFYYDCPLTTYRSYHRRIISDKFKWKRDNTLKDEDLNFNDPVFWYMVGLILSDGHIQRQSNTVKIYSKYAYHLHFLKKYYKIKSTLSKNNVFVLTMNSKKLKHFFVQNNIQSDKRYNVRFIDSGNELYNRCQIAGLFDGDGCIYFNYRSGMFIGNQCFISSGSQKMIEDLITVLSQYDFKYLNIDKFKSSVGNYCYKAVLRHKDEILNFYNLLNIKEIKNFRLKQKQIKFLKFFDLLELDKKYS